MRTLLALALLCACASVGGEQAPSPNSAPPVVVKTVPAAGAMDADPSLKEIRVTFSKPMQDGSWSWSTWGENTYPETKGKPHYLPDERTCVLPVKLEPGRFYATWLNSEKFRNFKDRSGIPAVPYLLTFQTAEAVALQTAGAAAPSHPQDPISDNAVLNEQQRSVVKWTDRQFQSFFDARSFDGWSDKDRTELETRQLDALKGPHSREYYQAINTLAALRSEKAVLPLLTIAAERREKDNRDRWMAIRALGIIGNKTVVPQLIHLVYHGNVNTRWWAQVSLVLLTGVNFGNDWQAWGKYWTEQGGQPPFNPEFVVWYKDPPFSDPQKAREANVASDAKFLADIGKK